MRLWLTIVLATAWLCLAAAAAEAQPQGPAPAPAPAGLGPAGVPVWNVGDEWTYRWESPRGKGTFTWVVERDEVVDGVADYVTGSGARDNYWRKSDLGFHLTKLEGKVEQRATPPHRDYVWPLTPGKSWEYTYTSERPLERQTDEFTIEVTVARVETVTVPAGTFQAFKLVHRNKRAQMVVGEWWYAPEVKSFVRQRFRQANVGWVERELVAFRLAGAASPSATAPAPPGPAPASPRPPTPPTAAAPVRPGSARAEFTHKVTYRVSGTAPEASITYRNAKGGTQQTAGRIPWEVTFDSRAGNFLYVSAQNQGATGSVTCDILVDGVVRTNATSTGAYVMAECSEANEP